jgi:pimeloyl-ACP methyl ester carboxylesterase
MPLISTRVGDISYSTHGTGPPIILLHATLHSRHDFDPIIPQLSLHYQLFAIDWPWHGESSRPTNQQPGATLFADVLEDIVDALNLPPAIFIGNSVGGFSAARLSITHPAKVKGLVLVNNGGFVNIDWTTRLFCRLLATPFLNRWIYPFLVWRYMAPQNAEDKRIATEVAAIAKTVEGSKISASLFGSFLDPSQDLRSRASGIKVPTLLIWGKKDPIVPPSIGQDTHKAIKGSRFEVLDTGHVVFASKPDEFLKLVEPFIKETFGAELK